MGLYTNMPSLSKPNHDPGIEKTMTAHNAFLLERLNYNEHRIKKLYEKYRPATSGISGLKSVVANVFLDKGLFRALL